MTYFVLRNQEKFGPYSIADVQRYVGTGEILLTDRIQGEGMQNWVTVDQLLNDPDLARPAGETYSSQAGELFPPPPNLHWALLLLLNLLTCGLFQLIWMFVEAAYASKIDSRSKSLLYYALGTGCLVAGGIEQAAQSEGLGALLSVTGVVLTIIGHFNLKSSLEDRFGGVDPIRLRLSGIMTFFFNTIYFQYHFNRINNLRMSGMTRRNI